ncbi:MAG: thioredoxin family protein [Prevotellaceae bacterium]|jgi:thiol:disulfide interchange protein DsbD|nr:thioredoxin family protein [Prevotellaceae bacterium]
MKNLFRNISIITIMLCGTLSFAQQNPVTWKTSVAQTEDSIYQIIFEADIENRWHLYDIGPYENGPNATVFTFDLPANARLIGGIEMIDKPFKKFDDMFGMEIGLFEKKARFSQKIKLSGDGATINANVEWMVCDDKQCLPPTDEDFTINVGTKSSTTISNPALSNTVETEQSQITDENQADKDKSLWAYIIDAILWGLIAILTPCVFPMLPMTVSFFMKGSKNRAKGKAEASIYGFFIILLYTLPIAAIILIIRTIGGDDTTASIFNWLSTHWLPNTIFFLVFVIFAASFFGAFDITLPNWMVNKSDKNADKGGMVGIFFMALTLVLVSFSCTGPIVSTIIIKAFAGEFWTPIVVMLVFSTVFALPFILAALFPSVLNKLPKSGGWLNSVKVILGFVEVALSLKFIGTIDQAYHLHILDREIYLAIWIVVFSLMGFYLLGKIKFAHDSEVKHIGVGRLTLVIITFSFVVYLIPGMWGAPLKALSGYLTPLTTQDFIVESQKHVLQVNDEGKNVKHSEFLHLPHGLKGFFDYKEASEYAQKVGKPLFIDITGHGCVNCREMEARVWSAPEVLDILNNEYVIVALYVDDRKTLPEDEWITTEKGKVLKTLGKINFNFVFNKYSAISQPHYVLEGRNGKILVPPRNYDLDVNGFVQFLKSGVEAYNNDKNKIENTMNLNLQVH